MRSVTLVTGIQRTGVHLRLQNIFSFLTGRRWDAPRTLTHEHEHRPHLREQIDPDSIQKRKIVTEQRTDRAISGSGGSLLAALAPLKFAWLDQKTANEAHIIAGASQKKG